MSCVPLAVSPTKSHPASRNVPAFCDLQHDVSVFFYLADENVLHMQLLRFVV
jgi:hypothetical protein